MRNAQTIKLLHAWTPANLYAGRTTVRVDPKISCARCGLALTRANRWFRCPGSPEPCTQQCGCDDPSYCPAARGAWVDKHSTDRAGSSVSADTK